MGERDVSEDMDLRARLSVAEYDQWILVNPSGSPPVGRYKHSAEVVGEKLYVVGGSRNGRYLSDIQVFDFTTLKWSTVNLLQESNSSVGNGNSEKLFPASASHNLVKWENKLLIVAGYSKESPDAMSVWSIDLETNRFSFVNTHGQAPTAREGHSVTLVGSRLLIFGGEDTKRQLLNDLHVLDLSAMSWDVVQTRNVPPVPRFDHTSIAHADQYLLIFGGSSHSTCFNDLQVLHLQTMEWSQPETQGVAVTPRGGHAGAIVDEYWYIVGGGDNRSGATETIVLNMSKLVWSLATSVRGRDPLASEGLTVCSATIHGEKLLVAFGGYNGKYNNELFVLKPKPRQSVQPRLFQSPAAAAAAASVTAAYAWTTVTDKNNDLMNRDGGNLRATQVESPPANVAVDTNNLISEKKTLESKIVEVAEENSRLKGRLDVMNDSHALLLMELHSVQGQLTAERSRCFKFEVEIAEIQKRLESMSSIEHELEVLQRQRSQIEHEMTVAQKQSSGGAWRWMVGTT